MNIREKTLVTIGITFIIAFLAILTLSFAFYTNTFLNIERDQASKDVIQTLHTFDNELFGMERSVGDWAWWDDTYYFVQDPRPEYIEENLLMGTFENLRLNYIVYLRPNGTVVLAKGYDHQTESEVPVPGYFISALSPDSPLLAFQEEHRKASGIIMSPDGLILVASAPILTSSEEGPSTGVLVMARNLDDAELALLSDVSGKALYLNVTGSSATGMTAAFAPSPLRSISVEVDQSDPEFLSAASAIGDTKGYPTFSIGIQASRDSYVNALSLIRDYFAIMTIMMAVFAGLVILIIDKLVLTRLHTLINRVQERSRHPGGEKLPPMAGNDEFNKLDEVIAESEQRIHDSEARFRRIVETALEGICIVDREFRLTYVNERLAGMYGGSVNEMLGRPITSLMAVEEVPDQQEKNKNRKEGHSEMYERKFVRKDGSVFFGLVSATPVFTNSVFSGSFVMITDITDRKRAETSLQLATRKLNILSRTALTDLTNQLFTLLGYSELSGALATDEKLKVYILKQRAAADKIQSQITYIKNFQDLGINPPKWQNVNSVFLYAISHLDLSSVTRTINVGTLEIYADPLLEKVLFTLVENTLAHGKSATGIRCYAEQTREEAVIYYEDNGIGIPEENKESIFQHHYTEKGLPLSLVREILSISDISIRETGEPGKGARFEIRIKQGFFRYSSQ